MKPSFATPRWSVLVLVLGGLALAAVPVVTPSGDASDDFESGTLTTAESPPGKWDTVTVGSTSTGQVSLRPAPEAAHRDAWGMRLVDDDASIDAGPVAEVRLHGLPAAVPTYRLRFWFKAQRKGGLGTVTLAYLSTSAGRWVAEVQYDPDADRFVFSGWDTPTDYSSSLILGHAAAGAWHLVEVVVTGMGTASGTRRFYLDGKAVLSRAMDLSNEGLSYLGMGAARATLRDFTGILDFDDVRLSPAPMASTLDVVVTGGDAGDCLPVKIQLEDSETGALAGAPYPLTVGLRASGVTGAFFAAPVCSTSALTALPFTAGQTTADVYFRASTTGTATLAAEHVDFLSVPRPVVIGGTPEPVHHVAVEGRPPESTAGEPVELRFELQTASNARFASSLTLSLEQPLPPGCAFHDEQGAPVSALVTEPDGEGRVMLGCEQPTTALVCLGSFNVLPGCATVSFTAPPESAQLELRVDGTGEAALPVGATVELTATVRNDGTASSGPLLLRLGSQGLQLRSAQVAPSGPDLALEDGALPLGSLAPGEERQVQVRGVLQPTDAPALLTVEVTDEAGAPLTDLHTRNFEVTSPGLDMGCSCASLGGGPGLGLLALAWALWASWTHARRRRAQAPALRG